MISEELRKYIDMCNEEVIINDQTDDMLYEMANVVSKYHGIDGVVIWVGIANKQHGLRVKVSNIRDHFARDDNFVIQMPSLDYDPDQVASWINKTTMAQIISWIKLNQQLLYDYENEHTTDTGLFLNSISKV